jgi:hypothetical protein
MDLHHGKISVFSEDEGNSNANPNLILIYLYPDLKLIVTLTLTLGKGCSFIVEIPMIKQSPLRTSIQPLN